MSIGREAVFLFESNTSATAVSYPEKVSSVYQSQQPQSQRATSIGPQNSLLLGATQKLMTVQDMKDIKIVEQISQLHGSQVSLISIGKSKQSGRDSQLKKMSEEEPKPCTDFTQDNQFRRTYQHKAYNSVAPSSVVKGQLEKSGQHNQKEFRTKKQMKRHANKKDMLSNIYQGGEPVLRQISSHHNYVASATTTVRQFKGKALPVPSSQQVQRSRLTDKILPVLSVKEQRQDCSKHDQFFEKTDRNQTHARSGVETASTQQRYCSQQSATRLSNSLLYPKAVEEALDADSQIQLSVKTISKKAETFRSSALQLCSQLQSERSGTAEVNLPAIKISAYTDESFALKPSLLENTNDASQSLCKPALLEDSPHFQTHKQKTSDQKNEGVNIIQSLKKHLTTKVLQPIKQLGHYNQKPSAPLQAPSIKVPNSTDFLATKLEQKSPLSVPLQHQSSENCERRTSVMKSEKHTRSRTLKEFPQHLLQTIPDKAATILAIEKETSEKVKRKRATLETNRDRSKEPPPDSLAMTLMNKTGGFFPKAIDTFSSNILCQSTTVEAFMRKAIQKMGWIEVPKKVLISSGCNFHIRFNIGDLQGVDADIKPNQMYNHFPDNREVTTKAGLCKNLWQSCNSEQEFRIASFFPRCYDLSDSKQALEFTQDFQQTAIFSIVKIMAEHFIATNATVKVLAEELERRKNFANPVVFKRKFVQKCEELDRNRCNLLGSDELRWACDFAKEFLKQRSFQDPTKKQLRKMNMSFYNQRKKVSEAELQRLGDFHNRLIENGIPQKTEFETFEQVKVVQLYNRLLKEDDQFRQIDGTHNVWIVKPSYSCRGQGIYCARSINQIMQEGKKTQQKIVQKYIERPLLINKKKFDFRQWVLVNSWEPLDVCVFSSPYLKLCGSQFDLKNLTDSFRHLSNFTLQKKGDTEISELIMNVEQFSEYMRSQGGKVTFEWEADLMPKICDTVWKTLKAMQDTQEQKNNCFEVYGLDIALDEELSPWLIEVNLSPACSERESWLTQMLDESAFEMLTHVQSRILLLGERGFWQGEMKNLRKQTNALAFERQKLSSFLNNEQFYAKHKPKDRWVRLAQSIDEIKNFNISAAAQGEFDHKLILEVQAVKVNLRTERKLDKNVQKMEKAHLVQRFWRGYKARAIAQLMRQTNSSVKINKTARMFLAKRLLVRLRRHRAATLVQTKMRQKLARLKVSYLKAQKLHALNIYCATKVQSLFRMTASKKFVQKIRLNTRAKAIQAKIRGFLSRKKTLKVRSFRCKIVCIQRFFKRRFRERVKSCKLLQKIIKAFSVRKKILRLLNVKKGASMVQKVLHSNWALRRKKRAQRLFLLNSKAVQIQSHLRRIILRKKTKLQLKNLLQERAQKKLRRILRRFIFKKVKLLAQDLKIQRDVKATMVQKYCKGLIERKRQLQAERVRRQNAAAVLVQKYLRGLAASNLALRIKYEIGAAIMIQSLWRGYKYRKAFKLKIQRRKDYLSKKEAREAKKTAASHYLQSVFKIVGAHKSAAIKPVQEKKKSKLKVQDQKVNTVFGNFLDNFMTRKTDKYESLKSDQTNKKNQKRSLSRQGGTKEPATSLKLVSAAYGETVQSNGKSKGLFKITTQKMVLDKYKMMRKQQIGPVLNNQGTQKKTRSRRRRRKRASLESSSESRSSQDSSEEWEKTPIVDIALKEISAERGVSDQKTSEVQEPKKVLCPLGKIPVQKRALPNRLREAQPGPGTYMQSQKIPRLQQADTRTSFAHNLKVMLEVQQKEAPVPLKSSSFSFSNTGKAPTPKQSFLPDLAVPRIVPEPRQEVQSTLERRSLMSPSGSQSSMNLKSDFQMTFEASKRELERSKQVPSRETYSKAISSIHNASDALVEDIRRTQKSRAEQVQKMCKDILTKTNASLTSSANQGSKPPSSQSIRSTTNKRGHSVTQGNIVII